MYTKVLSASALSETFTYQSYQNIYQKLQLSPIHSILPNSGKRRNVSHQSSKFPQECLEQLAWGLSRVQLPPLGVRERQRDERAKHLLAATQQGWQGQGLKGRALQPARPSPSQGAKEHFLHFSLWPLLF